MTENRKRIEYIDICKAIAIYCMVLGHTGVNETTNTIIHSFHMPVFFLMSGYCFDEEKYKKFNAYIKTRFCSLIIPYFIFGIGLFFLWDGALYVLHRTSEMRSVTNLLTSIFWNNANASAFGVIQWFLPCLFFSEIIFYAIAKVFKYSLKTISVILIILSLVGFATSFLPFRIPWALDCSLMASAFYGSGWMLKKAEIFDKLQISAKNNRYKSMIVLIVLLCVIIPSCLYNGSVNMRTLKYGNYFIYMITAFGMSFVCIMISCFIDFMGNGSICNRFLCWIGRNTLVILLLNSTCIRAWQVIGERITGHMNESSVYLLNAIIAVVVTIICTAFSELINQYMPWLLGKFRKKERV